ncbi:MAG: BTAD domain-containing putative transcriptional regulator, partial [Patulibacter sp.]
MGNRLPVRVLVLGRCRLEIAGEPVSIPPAQRRLVARLAASSQQPVGMLELFETLWDGDAPSSARATVHNQVSRLRARAGRDVITTVSGEYRLAVPTDVDELRKTVREAERTLVSDPARALTLAERASSLAGGVPFEDLGASELGVGLRREVDELIATAADHEVMAALALGLGARALPPARRATVAAPHDEARAARLAHALSLVGRRGEALAEIARVRRSLRTELGLDGSDALARMEAEILGGAPPAVEPSARRREIEDVLAAAERGDPVLVVGDPDTAAARVLSDVRDRLRGRGGTTVAMIRVQGYRDVAVAALLDLLDLLGIDPVPALGPVGTFVPAIRRLAEDQPVVLIVEQFDAAGPSTRRVLLEAARLDGVTLVAGSGSAQADGFDAVLTLADRHDDARAHELRRRFAVLPPAQRDTLTAVATAGDGVPIAALVTLGVADALDDVIGDGLLVRTANGGAAFRDGALREVVRADTPSGVRDELHHALGHVLVAHESREQAARHLLAAGAIEPTA